MRTFQFWILVLGATLVGVLQVKQIFLSRALNQQQRVLIDSEETAATAPTYERDWKQLAMAVYQASREDPALADVLKDSNVEIRSGPSATPAPETSPTPPTTVPKAPATP